MEGSWPITACGGRNSDSGTTSPGCHADRSDSNQRTVLESLFPEGPWRIAHIRTLFLHILPTIHNLWTLFHPAEASVTPPLVSFVMGHKKWMINPNFSRWDRVKVKDSQAVAAGLLLPGGSLCSVQPLLRTKMETDP